MKAADKKQRDIERALVNLNGIHAGVKSVVLNSAKSDPYVRRVAMYLDELIQWIKEERL